MCDPRILEVNVGVPTLRFLASQPSGFATTSSLIAHLVDEFEPTGEDAEILSGRSDIKFTQIVRNLVSHRDTPGNIVCDGYAEYDSRRNGLSITERGRQHLRHQEG